MEELIKKILEIAVFAPSGDNVQPWEFEFSNNTLYVKNIPEKDMSLFNFNQYGSLISHGALIENISICASHFDYSTNITYFPEGEDSNVTAKIIFEKENSIKSDLFHEIKKRHTNRKLYNGDRLTSEQKQNIKNSALSDKIEIHLVESIEKIRAIGSNVCEIDRLIFENKKVHEFLFKHIRWNHEEVIKTKDGFNIKTMELSSSQVAAFKMFKNWKVMKIFNTIGFPKVAVKGNLKLYSSSAAIIILTIPNENKLNFIELGKVLNKIWLTATKMDLSIHPLTATPLLMFRIKNGATKDLPNYQIDMIKKSYENIKNISRIEKGLIGFIFRIGKSLPPSGTSPRLNPKINFKK